jgi:hypothetical protein
MAPRSRPEHEGKHSLGTSIPWGLREKIWAYTIELSGVPYLYSYTGLPAESLSAAPHLPRADSSRQKLIGDEKHARRMRERHRREVLYQQQILSANDSDVEALVYDWESVLERAFEGQKNSQQEPSLPSVTRTHSMMLVN